MCHVFMLDLLTCHIYLSTSLVSTHLVSTSLILCLGGLLSQGCHSCSHGYSLSTTSSWLLLTCMRFHMCACIIHINHTYMFIQLILVSDPCLIPTLINHMLHASCYHSFHFDYARGPWPAISNTHMHGVCCHLRIIHSACCCPLTHVVLPSHS